MNTIHKEGIKTSIRKAIEPISKLQLLSFIINAIAGGILTVLSVFFLRFVTNH